MSTTLVEDKKVKKGSYSITAYSGGDKEMPLVVCCELSVTNMEREGYKSEYSNYIQLNCEQALEMIKDLTEFVHRTVVMTKKT